MKPDRTIWTIPTVLKEARSTGTTSPGRKNPNSTARDCEAWWPNGQMKSVVLSG